MEKGDVEGYGRSTGLCDVDIVKILGVNGGSFLSLDLVFNLVVVIRSIDYGSIVSTVCGCFPRLWNEFFEGAALPVTGAPPFLFLHKNRPLHIFRTSGQINLVGANSFFSRP